MTHNEYNNSCRLISHVPCCLMRSRKCCYYSCHSEPWFTTVRWVPNNNTSRDVQRAIWTRSQQHSKDGCAQTLVDLSVWAGVLVLHGVSFLYLFAESNFPYHHRQPHTVSTILLFILNSCACTEVTTALQGSSWSLWLIHSHCIHFIHLVFVFFGRCASSGGSLTILGENAQKHWYSGEFPFQSSHDHMVLYSPQCTETECVTILLQLHNCSTHMEYLVMNLSWMGIGFWHTTQLLCKQTMLMHSTKRYCKTLYSSPTVDQ